MSYTGGTTVLSDWIVVRIAANPGETFLDRMIALVEGAKRQKTPNEIALDILLAKLTIIFLLATVTLLPYSIYAVKAAGAGAPARRTRTRTACPPCHHRHCCEPSERHSQSYRQLPSPSW